MIAQVDHKIKRSLARAENGPQAQVQHHGNDKEGGGPEMSNAQQEETIEKIDQIEQKINVYNENAEKLGEQGMVDEAENVMTEVEKFKKQKAELEALLDST